MYIFILHPFYVNNCKDNYSAKRTLSLLVLFFLSEKDNFSFQHTVSNSLLRSLGTRLNDPQGPSVDYCCFAAQLIQHPNSIGRLVGTCGDKFLMALLSFKQRFPTFTCECPIRPLISFHISFHISFSQSCNLKLLPPLHIPSPYLQQRCVKWGYLIWWNHTKVH